MKRLAALIVALAAIGTLLLGATPRVDSQQGPQMRFEKASHNFGTLTKGGEEVEVEFRFVNSGDAPLIITRTTTSCRCITIRSPKRPVRAGAEGVITVSYDPKDEGVFNKSITVKANIPGGQITLYVSGEVVRK